MMLLLSRAKARNSDAGETQLVTTGLDSGHTISALDSKTPSTCNMLSIKTQDWTVARQYLLLTLKHAAHVVQQDAGLKPREISTYIQRAL